MNRREFLQSLSVLGFTPAINSCSSLVTQSLYPAPDFGNVTLFHITDCHAQLLPVYYREPLTHAGGDNKVNNPQYLTGQAFLAFFGIKPNSKEAYAFTCLDFSKAAKTYGKMGGFAQLLTLIKQIKQQSRHGNFGLLDGGDSWQGSATALWTQGRDMVDACNLLGVDVMTGHWEFTYGAAQVKANLDAFNGEFIAQNVRLSEEAQFSQNVDNADVFKPYVIKDFGQARIAVVGQAYPYTPIANPAELTPDWRFGIQEQRLQDTVNHIKVNKLADVVVLLSHNGSQVDLKLASRISGIDVILGGHTHDPLPKPIWVNHDGGRTCVTNAGSHGKFLGVLDLEIRANRLRDVRYRLLPVFANLLEPDAEMQALVNKIRQPYLYTLQEPLGVADRLLYRRDTYQGTFDELLLQAQLKVNNAQIALSPGFRWGTALLPGQVITYEDVMSQCAITYPNTLTRRLTGAEIKVILEDAADNVFNPDPYYQQGGDMVRAGGMTFRCLPDAETGQRISAMRLTDGRLVDAKKTYVVSSWASVKQPAEGLAMAEIVKSYLNDLRF